MSAEDENGYHHVRRESRRPAQQKVTAFNGSSRANTERANGSITYRSEASRASSNSSSPTRYSNQSTYRLNTRSRRLAHQLNRQSRAQVDRTFQSEYLRPRKSHAEDENTRGQGQPIVRRSTIEKGLVRRDSKAIRSDEKTFGDLERICVKNFRDAMSEYMEEGRIAYGHDYVTYMSRLADIYRESAMSTGNVYNILRATGLLNLCLIELQSTGEKERKDLLERKLLEFEYAMLKRVMKLKYRELSEFEEIWNSSPPVTAHLQEMRDLYAADFQLLQDCIRQLPNDGTQGSHRLGSDEPIAEDKIIAIVTAMNVEAFERVRLIFEQLFEESVKVVGAIPCKFVLVKTLKSGCSGSPYEPWSCFLLMEKYSPTIKLYFQNVLTVFAMKMIDIGEIRLPELNIRSLNWLDSEMERASAFGLYDFVDIVGSKRTKSVLIDGMRAKDDLAFAATSDKAKERMEIYNICELAQYITGDSRLFKDLIAVRQLVIQREQVDPEYKRKLFGSLQNLITETDPFYNMDLLENHGGSNMDNFLNFSHAFQKIVFDLEKTLSSDTPKLRLEEMTSPSFLPLSSVMTIQTVVENEQLKSQFVDDLDDISSPKLLLPVDQGFFPHSHSLDHLDTDNIGALKKLKENKQESQNTFRSVKTNDEKSTVSTVKGGKSNNQRYGKELEGTTWRPREASSFNADDKDLTSYFREAPRQLNSENLRQQTSTKVMIPQLNDARTQPKNASRRVIAAKKQATNIPTLPPLARSPEQILTPEPYERLVPNTPYYIGKPKGLLSDDLVHNLTLLHSLTQVLQLTTNTSIGNLATEHELPRLDEQTTRTAYLKILQVILPLLDILKSIVRSTGTISTLKKLLWNIELNPLENELAVALTLLHNGSYKEACKAIYNHLEAITDVTFVGEPLPWDVNEVCEELLETGEITVNRYHGMHTILAQAQMKRDNYSDALYHWKILLTEIDNAERCAEIHMRVGVCCTHLEKWVEGLEAAHKALRLYKGISKSSQKYIEKTAKAREIISVLERRQDQAVVFETQDDGM